MTSLIPHINLLILPGKPMNAFEKAFEDALRQYGMRDKISFTIHRSEMSALPNSVKSDLVVSPANSYAILDGGFDDAISRAFSLKEDYFALTRHCQLVLYNKYRGFQPPGSAVVIEIPPQFRAEGVSNNVWGTKFIGHCPTMRTPSDCRWDREVVYECIWCLLCEIDQHNTLVKDDENDKIRSILMTPMGTATGFVSAKKWACQTVLAMKHFIDAVDRSLARNMIHWHEADVQASAVKQTHAL